MGSDKEDVGWIDGLLRVYFSVYQAILVFRVRLLIKYIVRDINSEQKDLEV